MWEYTDQVMELFYNPRNQGKIVEKEEHETIVTGEVGSIACGDALRLYLKIDEQTQTIVDASFQTFGCASAIASSSALTELLKGKTVDEALAITNQEIAAFLGGLPEEKMHCSVMGQEALEAAIAKYRGVPLETHVDEDEGALICRCFAISEARIRRLVTENKLTTAAEVTNYIKAGGGCGSCLATIDDLIAAVQAEAQQAVAVATEMAATKESKPLTNLQKMRLIEEVLEEQIRPVLIADGGDVELYDIQGDRVQVILKGACGSCPSSNETLKVAIQARLQDAVLPSLVVEAV